MHDAATGGEFVGMVAILVIFGMPIAYLITHRYFAHQERMAMIQRGLTPPPDTRWAARAARQGWYAPNPAAAGYDPYVYAEWYAQRSLRKGITTAMIGFALLIGLSWGLGPSGPWLLGGLIPLFVGIAQIIVAVLGGARLGGFAAGPPQPPPVGQQPGAPYQQTPFAGTPSAPGPPYGWRPGPTTELENPPSPPEAR
ncbi:MAG TPA: DUF6249 domain-containing protein [Candidatus Baltobacteraceae bacterium]|jgi:hypothetical protein|nr:DUF6249 domain-containing protein [Candidatus Baltobacteraceae bacterium]